MPDQESSGPQDWLSYDSVADTYERVAVPWFTSLARDLVAAIDPRTGEVFLDVGTGTGLVAHTVLEVEPGVSVVGVDPSRGMLACIRPQSHISTATAMAPGLPFRAGVFDAVTANLVISHLPNHADGLIDMVRVLRRGGRLACSAWAAPEPSGAYNMRQEADQIVESVKDRLGLASHPPQEAVPWEDWFRDRRHLERALRDAGLAALQIRHHVYPWTFSVREFLAGWGSCGRYMRYAAGEERWHTFVDRAAAALLERFGDEIRVVSSAWIATGTGP